MPSFATGKNAYFISDRSGFRYPYKDMKIEWTGAAVGPDEFEPKTSSLEPRSHPADPQALRLAKPDTNNIQSVAVKFPSLIHQLCSIYQTQRCREEWEF